MTAEQIAAVIGDFKTRRVQMLYNDRAPAADKYWRAEAALVGLAPVIDATTIYRELDTQHGRHHLYDDHLLRPPLTSCSVAYVNRHGNVTVMHVNWIQRDEVGGDWAKYSWDETADPVDWSTVEWIATVSYWVGGRNGTGASMQTRGPAYAMRWAINPDGTPADLRWLDLTDTIDGDDPWLCATIVLMRCVTFLNCRNVIITEPHRPRAQARRLARAGVVVNEVTIAKVGEWARRAGAAPPAGTAVPLTTVRGHLARYGVDGRGLLFGRIAGTFWIPAHARGSAEYGERQHNYALAPDA